MIITKLNGGLGNQIFQYSLGRRLATKHQTTLKLDILNFEKDPLRSYCLENFNIQENFADKNEINKLEKRGWQKIINNLLPYPRRSYIQEKKIFFDENILRTKDNVCLDGYWQSEKYFKDIENIIRAEITLKKELSDEARQIEKNILSTNSISLHIRHGDYLNQKMSKIFEICGHDYYSKAIDKITETEKNPTFFIFSDDITWVKNNLSLPRPHTLINRDKKFNDCEELILMNRCKNNIIANSSFSWWGAWLNNNPDKIVIAPKKWFKDARDIEDLIPSSWIKI